MTGTTETPPRRIPVALLSEPRWLGSVRPGAIIVAHDNSPYETTLALTAAIAVDHEDVVELHVAEAGGIRSVGLRVADILRLADWLRSRGHRLPEER